jgi:UDP-3-O-[3-hydroxymyristoyl] glucosamine N-acyltransferase
MEISLREAADFIGGKIFGSDQITIVNLAKIEDARQGDLTFLYLPQYSKFFPTTKASAIIVKPDFDRSRDDISYIVCDNPNIAFQKIVMRFFVPEVKHFGIDPSANIHPSVKLGSNVSVGKNVVISENCEIGDNTIILHNTTILENVKIGSNTLIYSNVAVREKCVIGSNVIIHSGTVIGSDGFGFQPDAKGIFHKIPQIGNVVIEDDVELGSNVSVDRAALGSTIIMKGTKIDNLVQVAHGVSIGRNTVISGQAGISGSTKIGNNCMIAGQVGMVGHIEIGDFVQVGAQSGISKSIPKAGAYMGAPAIEIKKFFKLNAHIHSLPEYADKIKALEKKIEELEEKLRK